MKQNNRGITLVELLAVLAIIAVLAVIIYPIITTVISQSTNSTDEATKTSIKEAAEMYVSDMLETTDSVEGDVYLTTLVENGYLDNIDEDTYNLDTSKVKIEKDEHQYVYTVTLNRK